MKKINKLKPLSVLKRIISQLKKQNKRIVFTNGCFDLIHPGHIKVLREAKSKGDILIVGLNSDSSVRKIKGGSRPILNEKARIEVLSALEFVDYIILFKSPTPLILIKALKPDYLVKGGDWQGNRIVGREYVKRVYRVKLYPKYSTTKIIQKIKKQCP